MSMSIISKGDLKCEVVAVLNYHAMKTYVGVEV
jgi:hypothetical protein